MAAAALMVVLALSMFGLFSIQLPAGLTITPARAGANASIYRVQRGDQTLLIAGETAGLSIKHGCRQGICHECTCRLNHGSVRDLTSGERIDGEGQPIRLCVSSAMSDLDLESLN